MYATTVMTILSSFFDINFIIEHLMVLHEYVRVNLGESRVGVVCLHTRINVALLGDISKVHRSKTHRLTSLGYQAPGSLATRHLRTYLLSQMM
jgi:hypothetical protein